MTEDKNENTLPFTKSEENTLMVRRYTIEKIVGEGSYAKVFLGKKEALKKKKYLACKVIDTKNAPVEYVNKFLPRELQVLMKITHPNIIHIDFIFQRRSKYYIFMRYAEIGDLLDYLMSRGRVSENRARFWIIQCGLALYYLHDMNITHRDIKCENILITESLNVKLCDFGFSRYIEPDGFSTTYCGSIAYTAPEILRGRPYHPTKADIWSLGVVLYVMLNRKLPFPDVSPRKVLEKQMGRTLEHTPKVDETMSIALRSTFLKLLEPDVRSRFSAKELLHCSWVIQDPRYENQVRDVMTTPSAVSNNKKLIKQAKERAKKGESEVTVLRPAGNDEFSMTSVLGISTLEQDLKEEAAKERVLSKARQQKQKRTLNFKKKDTKQIENKGFPKSNGNLM